MVASPAMGLHATMSRSVRPLLCLGLALLGTGLAHGSAPDAADAETLKACQATPAQAKAAYALAARWGTELRTDIAAPLLASGCDVAVKAFVSAFEYQRSHQTRLLQSDVDAMGIGGVRDPKFFELDEGHQTREYFLGLASKPYSPSYRSRELYQLFYDSLKRKLVESPGSTGPTSSHHWAAPEYLLTQSDMAQIEEPDAALLQLMTHACQATRLISIFEQRHYLPAFERMRALYLRTPVGTSACDWEIAKVMASLDVRATAEAILARLRWLYDQPAGAVRDGGILSAADAFSDLPPAVLAEHASLESEVRSHLQDPAPPGPAHRFFERMGKLSSQSRDFTPEGLSYWIAAGSADRVRETLAHGVDVNAPLVHGESALSQALGTGRLDVVQVLVQAGANVNHRLPGDVNSREPGGNGRPMLSLAVCARPKADSGRSDESAALASLLLTHGARVQATEIAGESALHLAARCGNTATLAALVAAGADVNAKRSPTNGLPFASSGDQWAYATPLHYAARSQHPENAAFLLDHGARINARTANGATPLWWAVAAADLKLVSLLLDRGADFNLAANDDLTPVVVAHELVAPGERGQDARAKQIEALLVSRGAVLNPITLAKHQLLAAIIVALMATSHGEGFH
jgi:ankyrin repeat protein